MGATTETNDSSVMSRVENEVAKFVFDVVHAVDLGAKHGDESWCVAVLTHEDRTAVVACAPRKDGLRLPQRLRIHRVAHDRQKALGVALHQGKMRGIRLPLG